MAKEHGVDLSTLEGSGAGGPHHQAGYRSGDRGIVRRGAGERSGNGSRSCGTAHTSAGSGSRGTPWGGGSTWQPVHSGAAVGVPRERLYFGNYEVHPLSVMRQKIAEHMVASKHVSRMCTPSTKST